MGKDAITVELSGDEALVLFEFLARYDQTDQLSIIDQAEERALWNLHAILERILVELLKSNYDELIREARNRLRDED